MDKLTLSDIKIKSPGKQLKELVLVEFGDIDKFADAIGMKTKTVIQYLKETNLGSDTFKIRTSKAFNKGLDELIKTEEEQVKYMVQSVYDNIKVYKTDQDISVLEKVQELCIKNNLRVDNVKMQRNLAMAYFYKNEIEKAIGFMESAISAVKAHNYLIKWKSELGLMYFYQREYEKAERYFKEVDDLLSYVKETDDESVFLHYYRYGILKNNTGKHGSAERLFEKSLEYAKTSTEKGRAIMNIGISNKKRKKYKKAVEYYNKALDVLEDNSSINIIFNNFAELYRVLEEYDKALYYIELSFNCIEDENLFDMFVTYGTYAQILMSKGEIGKAIGKLIELINRAEDTFVYKKFIINRINIIIEYGGKIRNINILKEMEELIYKLIKNCNSNHKEYITELTTSLGQIRLYTKDIKKLFPKKGGVFE